MTRNKWMITCIVYLVDVKGFKYMKNQIIFDLIFIIDKQKYVYLDKFLIDFVMIKLKMIKSKESNFMTHKTCSKFIIFVFHNNLDKFIDNWVWKLNFYIFLVIKFEIFFKFILQLFNIFLWWYNKKIIKFLYIFLFIIFYIEFLNLYLALILIFWLWLCQLLTLLVLKIYLHCCCFKKIYVNL